jgi:hypothetical protein
VRIGVAQRTGRRILECAVQRRSVGSARPIAAAFVEPVEINLGSQEACAMIRTVASALLGLPALVSLALAAPPAEPKKPGAADTKAAAPYVTSVVELHPKVDGRPADPALGGVVHRPTATRIDSPYYDVPFAVNVPFQVPFDGGAVRVYVRAAVHWPEAPKDFVENRFTFSRGLHRPGGAAPAADSVFFDLGGSTDREDWTPLKPDDLGPIRVWGFPREPGREPLQLPVIAEESRHVPFSDGHSGSFILAPAAAGSYVFWFSIDEGEFWSRLGRARESLEVRFRVDLLVARGERAVTRASSRTCSGAVRGRPACPRTSSLSPPPSKSR